MQLHYFQVVDADKDEPVAVIQAVSEKHAIGRFTLIKPLLKRKKHPGSFWTVQRVDTITPTVPYYSDAYFQILESALAPE